MEESNSIEKFEDGLKRNGEEQNEVPVGATEILWETDDEYLDWDKYENPYTDKNRWGFPICRGGVGMGSKR